MTDKTPLSSENPSTLPGGKHLADLMPPASLIILRGPQAGESIQLQPGINLFGREEGIIFRDSRVSRSHAQIEYRHADFVLTDLESTNGTFVNGDRIKQKVILQHGDTIRMGDTILSLRLDGSEVDPEIVGARTPESKLERDDATMQAGCLTPTRPASEIEKKKNRPKE